MSAVDQNRSWSAPRCSPSAPKARAKIARGGVPIHRDEAPCTSPSKLKPQRGARTPLFNRKAEIQNRTWSLLTPLLYRVLCLQRPRDSLWAILTTPPQPEAIPNPKPEQIEPGAAASCVPLSPLRERGRACGELSRAGEGALVLAHALTHRCAKNFRPTEAALPPAVRKGSAFPSRPCCLCPFEAVPRTDAVQSRPRRDFIESRQCGTSIAPAFRRGCEGALSVVFTLVYEG
jgi:hypothetical protein